MFSISALNDLLWTILIISSLASSIICTSIKSLLSEFKQVFPPEIFDNSFYLNNITSASNRFIFTQLETRDSKIDKIPCFSPYWQLPRFWFQDHDYSQPLEFICAFPKKTSTIKPLINFMSLVSNNSFWCIVSGISFTGYILPLIHIRMFFDDLKPVCHKYFESLWFIL